VEGHYFANHYSQKDAQNGRLFVRTVLTVDNGEHWIPVQPPRDSKRGRPYACHVASKDERDHGCTVVQGAVLHMKLLLGGLTASKTSHGIVIANGQVLTQFPKDRMGVHASETFLSRNGGISWEVVLDNACQQVSATPCLHRFAFGDHGSILAAVPAKGEVKRMMYTLDQGITWHHVDLPQFSMLSQVSQQLEAESTSFMVVGQAQMSFHREGATTTKTEGLVVFVDFSGLKQRRCMGEEWAGKGGSDYEKWSPRSSTGIAGLPRCFNGHETSYVRRMRLNDCKVHIRRQLLEHRHHCGCTVDDYECRGESGDVCLPPTKALTVTVSKLCHESGHDSKTKVQGYRHKDSDTCKSGVQLPIKATACGVVKPNHPLPGVTDIASRGPELKVKMPLLPKAISNSGASSVMMVVIFCCLFAFLAGGVGLFLYMRGSAKVSEYEYGMVGDDHVPNSAVDEDGPEESMTGVIDEIRDIDDTTDTKW